MFCKFAPHNETMAQKTKAPESEVEAYQFIRENLKEVGWNIKNPARFSEGQVYTQGQCAHHPELDVHLGRERPENIVKISETEFWVIEAKSRREKLQQAVNEAKDYAKLINKSKNIRACIVTGIAGNDSDFYEVQSHILVGKEFRPITINGKVASSLLSPDLVRDALRMNGAIQEVPINEALFLKKAEEINRELHLGAINKNQRARVMAALLLSMLDDTLPNVDASPVVLIRDINARAESILGKHKKGEFFKCIEISLPPTEDNHIKYKAALVRTLQQLNNLNIRSAMNSSADVLGKFYEVFLKYGNGAKELGIVLTPRHITTYGVRTLDVTPKDIVYDPACGTGGFLVAAFDHVKKKAAPAQLETFKKYALFGVEQEPEVAALAIVNMIFRGDGKNNIVEGNCLAKQLVQRTVNGTVSAEFADRGATKKERTVTKVLMNPPFAIKRQDEREYKFVDHALEQMEHGGLLFAVLPFSVLVKPKGYERWRADELLKKHTLLAVVTLPPELFYPVGVHTVGVYIKKGVPHPKEKEVLWYRAKQDGLVISKGKRIHSDREPDVLQESEDLVKSFVHEARKGKLDLPMVYRTAPIDWTDDDLELVPEAYLTQAPPTIPEVGERVDDLVRSALAFVLTNDKNVNIEFHAANGTSVSRNKPITWGKVRLDAMFNLTRGKFHSINDLLPGEEYVVSRITTNNGVDGRYTVPEKATHYEPGAMTVSTVGGDAFIQVRRFVPTDNVVVCTPKEQMPLEVRVFAAAMVNHQKWRYGYGRQCYMQKLKKALIDMPVKANGSVDVERIERIVRESPYWQTFVKTL